MKKILCILTMVFAFAIQTNAQITGISFATVAITAKDSVLTGDTVYIKPGLTIANPYADSIATLKFYLPTTPKDGQIFHITVTKKVSTITYLNGTTVSLPNAVYVTEPTTRTLTGKINCVGGAFAIVYRSKKAKWYKYQ